jgi:membrane-associated phospholipid phosphatase
MKTPSYPSGHSAQAFLIGYLLSDMFPKYKEQFMKTAKDISYSRNVARCHYRTDSKFGEYLGKEMYNYIRQIYGV